MTSGIIGLGTIGSRVAAVLRAAGRRVYVWSPTPRPVPDFLGSPAEVATAATTVQLFVSDARAVLEVVEAMLPQLTPEHIVINSATIDPETTRTAASLVNSAAAAFLDCPFTGSLDAAAAGELVYYAGGNRDALERARPHLDAASRQVLHVGEIGHASTLKLAANMVGAATVTILGEALALVRSQGLSGAKFARALELSAAGSPLTAAKLRALIDGDYTPHFSLANMLKDAGYAAGLASRSNLDLPLLTRTVSLLELAGEEGAGGEDFAAVTRRLNPPRRP
jgi:3-hydroxyisobutyrate dehydrogenase-like beta-hydroxyacid dehydrogenase